MSTYVLVPGMCHGGWCFDDLAVGLRAAGHTVHELDAAHDLMRDAPDTLREILLDAAG